MPKPPAEQILDMAKDAGVIRARDLDARGIPRVYLRRLCDRGLMIRSGRGMYVPADAPLSEHHSLVEVCQRVRGSIVCLLSALRFHELTMQNPFEVWITIDRRARRPKVDYPPLRVVLASGAALTAGVQEHLIEGLPVRVYSPAKTVADCFKYRNQVGLDVALEALHACWRQRRATMAELWEFARVCRVSSVMRPYLEAVPHAALHHRQLQLAGE